MLDYEAGELRIEGNNYYVQDKKRFQAYVSVLQEDKTECFNFAYDMSYGKEGEHRDLRSGGSEHRKKGQIFINTFQGKMAEYALYRYFSNRNISMEKPDTKRYKLGKWDDFDLEVQGKHISVKSTKSYGNLLLLETKDWNDDGQYKPNIGNGNSKYDYTILVRFKPDGEKIMRINQLLYQKDNEIPDNIKEILKEKIYDEEWSYDFPGFIYFSELVKMIKQRRIIPKGAMLNGRTQMDAENYYFQTGNMHEIFESYRKNPEVENDDRAELRLIRICPKCGRNLVLRHGYNYFWGCQGYSETPKCTYKDNVY